MNIENLIEGADAYTTLAEVSEQPQADAPEATPVISAAVVSGVGGAATAKWGC
jgi:hypothetical protein